MNKNIKKIMTVFTLILAISSILSILSINASASAEPETPDGKPSSASSPAVSGKESRIILLEPYREYTIEELREIAVRNSRQALADDVDIKRKELAVRTVRSDANAMSDSILSVTKPMDVKLELEAAQKAKQDHLEQLKLDVYKAAVNILLCIKKIEMLEQKLDFAEEKLEMAEARHGADAVARHDVDSARYNADSAVVNLNNAREDLGMLYLELRNLLNQEPETTPVKISGDIKQEKIPDVNMDSLLEGLYKTETSVCKAAGKLDIAGTAMDIAAKLYQKGVLYYDNAALDLEEAELDLAAAKTALEVKVKNAFNIMANKRDNLELAAKYADLAAKKLSEAKLKYDKGIIGREELTAAEEALLDAEYGKLAAIAEFNIARAEFTSIAGMNAPEEN